MKPVELFLVGKLIRVTGSEREVVIRFTGTTAEEFKKLESVFIKLNYDLVPFFIEKFRVKSSDQAYVMLLDSENCLENGQLPGSDVYISENQHNTIKASQPWQFKLDGYMVVDRSYGNVGIITGILDLPQQLVLQVKHSDKEILIPFVPEIVQKVDHRKKMVHIAAPEGLIEIYL